jgi:hypothetical protein
VSHDAPDQAGAPEALGSIVADLPAPTRRPRVATWWALSIVLGATIWFRLPILVNATALNSDAAVVGLQARHILRGEWSPFLWGTRYQSSIEAVFAAGIFAVAGATPLALLLVPMIGYLLASALAYDLLRTRTSPRKAALLMMPMAVTAMPVNIILLNVARSWSITAVFASAWLLDGASRSRRPLARLAAGCYLGLLAIYLDFFSVVFLGGLALLAVAATRDDRVPRGIWSRRLLACGGGAAAGVVTLWIVRGSTASPSEATLTTARLARNLHLLLESCLPWTIGRKTFVLSGMLNPAPWSPPAAYAWVPPVGAWCFAILLGASAIAVASRARSDWHVSRLGAFGLAVAASAIAAFLFSGKPEDVWSARYLAPIVLAAPFALAPACRALGRWFPALLLPYLVAAAVSGWLAYGDETAGPFPAPASAGMDRDVAALRDALRERGVRHGAAQYWLSYRLSFLFEEDPIIVPLEPYDDRYPPYRDAVVSAPIVAFIFHPSEPRARPEPVETILRGNGTRFERLTVGGFTALVATRSGSR